MDWTNLVGLLALFTLIIGLIVAMTSKRQVERRLDDDDAPKSTLARDADSKGPPADV